MSKEITRKEAALAWAQEQKVEAKPELASELQWGLVEPVGGGDGLYNPRVFTTPNEYRFRLASIPVPHIRSWELEEVPIGALIRHDQWNLAGLKYMICGVEKDQVVWMSSTGPGKQTFNQLLSDPRWRHSVDSGRTWHPCGVKVMR